MPLTCSICSHPQRGEIETALVSRVALRRIAAQFGTSDTTLRRHKQNCMQLAIEHAQAKLQEQQATLQEQTAQIVAQAEEERAKFSWNVLTEMQWLHDEAWSIYRETRAEKEHRLSLQALSELRQQTKLFSELLTGTEPGDKEKMEEEWVAIRDAIFKALEPYPEARLATARALIELGREKDGSDSTLSSDQTS